MHLIKVDWATFKAVDEIWDSLCTQAHEPAWHGRNLNALADSWITGSINPTGPPYDFEFLNLENVPLHLREIALAIIDIAKESVAENGGSCRLA